MDYDDQLARGLSETPDVAERTDRFEVPQPETRTEGSVTVVENFRSIADRLDREPAHVMRFLQSTLGTSASIDDRTRLRLTGSFDADRVGDAVDDYVTGYVRCPECSRPDTRLENEQGAEVRNCTACGAVSPVEE